MIVRGLRSESGISGSTFFGVSVTQFFLILATLDVLCFHHHYLKLSSAAYDAESGRSGADTTMRKTKCPSMLVQRTASSFVDQF